MDRAEVLREMIAEKQRLIELYQAMVTEWQKELGMTVTGGNDGQKEPTSKATTKSQTGDLLNLVRDYEFFRKSQPEAAKAFLEKVGHPVKTQVILDAIQKGGVTVGGKEESRRVNFYTILNRSPYFGLAGRDAWGLIGWGGVTKKEKDSNGDTGDKKDEAEDKKEQTAEAK